jgi:hypothetical protein
MAWQDRGACLGLPDRVFFEDVTPSREDGTDGPVDPAALKRAQGVCGSCPVRMQCFQYVMDWEGPAAEVRRHGVFAGLSGPQRAAVRRRDTMKCWQCGEVYDPLGLAGGDLYCACGPMPADPIPPDGDRWLPRHTALVDKVVAWLLENTRPEQRAPSPSALVAILKTRKDDTHLVYGYLVREGLLRKGETRGAYFRATGKRALAQWRPAPLRSRTGSAA